MKFSANKFTPGVIRYLDFISHCTTNIRYIKGPQNIIVDALSRKDITAITDDILTHYLISDERNLTSH